MSASHLLQQVLAAQSVAVGAGEIDKTAFSFDIGPEFPHQNRPVLYVDLGSTEVAKFDLGGQFIGSGW